MELTTQELHTLGIALSHFTDHLREQDGPMFRLLADIIRQEAEENGVPAPYVPTMEDCERLKVRLEAELERVHAAHSESTRGAEG